MGQSIAELRRIYPVSAPNEPLQQIQESFSSPVVRRRALHGTDLDRHLARSAVRISHVVSDGILNFVPEAASHPALMQAARVYVELTTRHAALVLHGRIDTPAALPGIEQCAREFVRLGVSAELLSRIARLCHKELAGRLIAPPILTDELDVASLVSLSARLFSHLSDTFDSLMRAHAVQAGMDAIGNSPWERRIVADILAGRPVDLERAAALLSYDFSGIHVGFVADMRSLSTTTTAAGSQLEVIANAITGLLGGRGLTVCNSETECWGWVTVDVEATRSQIAAIRDQLPVELCVGIGRPGRGSQGFRDTHWQAKTALAFVGTAPDPTRAVLFRDIEVATLLMAEPARARAFAERELGALAASSDVARELRQTLRVYLEEHGSPQRTAQRLGVVRNTVSHRVARAVGLLGRSVDERRAEMHAALVIAAVEWGG
jgi:hypothetical protein